MKRRLLTLMILLALTATASAAPIRVGIFKGTAQGRYWHTSIHTAGKAIASILAHPEGAGFVDPMVSPEGFSVRMFGVDSAQCSGSCAPTVTQVAEFIAALDSLDVVVVSNFTDIGRTLTDTSHRARFAQFIRRKGLVSVHMSTDSYGSWPAWDSTHGTRFQNHPSSDRQGTVRHDSAAMTDPAWRFLNRGLPDTVRFLEEWISFTTNGNVIRAVPGLKVTTNLDEASVAGGFGGARVMGDHPYSWYREFPEGGRFFYTAIGHRAELFTGLGRVDSLGDTTRPANHYLRRQLYNGILWTAGYNEDGSRTVVGVRSGGNAPGAGNFSDAARVSNRGGTLAVSVLQDGPHSVDVRAADGRLVASRQGTGRLEHRFEGLRPGVYTLSVKADGGVRTRIVIP